ncbi:hypothetical protein HaLaN_14386 [Haematococcus lacustris]|uniref:Uncharacterized protein n=1 Tax=Haematococcus lacustris TaxID=44745 RepID=A0A699Z6G5_HAELA|nr:hypothetical protein HaLaN_14386 [Haematococcus lacustris]
MPWSPPSFRAPEPSFVASEPAHVGYYVGHEVGLLAHRALTIAFNKDSLLLGQRTSRPQAR